MSNGRSAARIPVRPSGPRRATKGSARTVGGARASTPMAADRGERTVGKRPAHSETARGLHAIIDRTGLAVEAWAPTAARVLLGLVLAWFGYHELVAPGLWTGYVPLLSATSQASEVLVLAHGWVLLLLAAALAVGIAPRLAAFVAAVMLFEIVVSLTVAGGLSDLVLRDVGVFGLAVAIAGTRRQRLLLRR